MDFQGFAQTGVKPIILQPQGSARIGSVAIPKSANFVYATIIGPGGNGGVGQSAAPGGGGGGGGSGGVGRALIPASVFNGVLYYKVGSGGTAEASAIFMNSDISINAGALITSNQGSAGGAGAAGGGAAGATAAAGSTLWPSLGLVLVGPTAGGAGGANTGTVGATVTTNFLPTTTGGAGGGGCTAALNAAGGPVTYTSVYVYTLAGGVVLGGAGNNGWIINNTMSGFGGSGGGSNFAGVGGAGGRGAIGCGGGGGGAGTTGGAGGIGGNGQIMLWWL
jgi:hypothetical protein